MSDLHRVRINRASSQSGSTVHGMRAILFGSPFAFIGACVMLLASGVIPVDPESIEVPRWFMFLFGLAFGVVGFALIVHGFRGVARERRRERLLARNPEEPWFADHPWNPRFSMDANLHKLMGYTLGSTFAVVVIGLITWLTFSDPNVSAWVRYLIVGIDLVVFLYPVYTAVIWMRYFSPDPVMARRGCWRRPISKAPTARSIPTRARTRPACAASSSRFPSRAA